MSNSSGRSFPVTVALYNLYQDYRFLFHRSPCYGECRLTATKRNTVDVSILEASADDETLLVGVN